MDLRDHIIWCSIGQKKLVNRGFLVGPYCPIYGFGALAILTVTEPLVKYPPLVFLAAMVVATVLEYFTGWLLEALFQTKWWDYSKRKFNLKGRICLRNSLLFGVLGLAATYLIHPSAEEIVDHIPSDIQRVLASILFALLVLDLFHTLYRITNLKQRLEGIKEEFSKLSELNREYSWFDSKDLNGSLEELRKLCLKNPDDETSCAILKQIDGLMDKKLGTNRILKAFPNMVPKEFSEEFSALKESWQKRQKSLKGKVKTTKERIKQRRRSLRESFAEVYKGLTFSRLVWLFLIGSVAGYIVETIYCLVKNGVIESRQGMLYGPFSQIYGFAAILLALVLIPLSKKGDLWAFIGSGVLGGLFEAGCSLVQEYVFHSTSWGYSNDRFSLFGGRTSVTYMFFWGILGTLYIKFLYPKVVELIDAIPKRPKNFFTWVIFITLSANMILSAAAVYRWSAREAGQPAGNFIEVFLDEQYPDEFMKEVYPNMQIVKKDE